MRSPTKKLLSEYAGTLCGPLNAALISLVIDLLLPKVACFLTKIGSHTVRILRDPFIMSRVNLFYSSVCIPQWLTSMFYLTRFFYRIDFGSFLDQQRLKEDFIISRLLDISDHRHWFHVVTGFIISNLKPLVGGENSGKRWRCIHSTGLPFDCRART